MSGPYTDKELAAYADFYEQHGAVRLPGLISSDLVTKVLAAIDDAAAAFGPGRAPGKAMSFGRGEGRMTIRYMWRENPFIKDFLFREALAEPLARVTRCKELRFWFDLTFIHEAAGEGEIGEGTGWHHDIPAFGFKGEKLPSLWMAMTPSTAANSRLEFIDGSHKSVPGFFRTPTAPVDPADGMLTIPDYDELVKQGREKILTWDCAPGDAIVIHPYTIHGAKGNTGSKAHGRRVAITTRWLGDDVRWLPNDPKAKQFLSDPSEKPLPIGARPAGENFPLIWKENSRIGDVRAA